MEEKNKKMQYRNLGRSGLMLSELSFGSWVTFNKQVDSKLAEEMFGICLDAGVNFFDNAEGYERGLSEIVMGRGVTQPQPLKRLLLCELKGIFWSP